MEVVHKLSPSMLRDVWSVNTPFGMVVVWESFSTEDRGQRDRYVVSLDGSLEIRTIKTFSEDGFFSGTVGFWKSEAIKRAQDLAKLAAATQHPLHASDPILAARRRAQFFALAKLWGVIEKT